MSDRDQSGRPRGRRGSVVRCIAALAACAGALLVTPAMAAAAEQGQVKIIRDAVSDFANRYVDSPTAAEKAFMRSHYFQFRGYAPFHDRALSWGPPSTFYLDLYAIYRNYDTDDGKQLLADHPDWVLHDASGKRLYIPFACEGGSCPQYAADITNPAFRKWWIDRAKAIAVRGYAGLYIDDVNMEMMVGNGNGDLVAPIDRATGRPMTEAVWRSYVTQFAEQVKREMPGYPITHNSGQWWVSHDDPSYQREVQAASTIELERGFSQDGLDDGTGKFGFRTYLKHVDWLHSMGDSVVVQPYDLDPQLAEFELASYYLVNDGEDAIATDYRTDPDNWWRGWETDLGAAHGPRYAWQGVIRRDFDNGFVLVNPPEASTRTVDLGGSYQRLDGSSAGTLTLGETRGAVLLGTPPAGGEAPHGDEQLAQTIGTATVAVRVQPKRRALKRVVPVIAQISLSSRRAGHWVTVRKARVRIAHRGRFQKRFRRLPAGHYRATVRRLTHRPVRVLLHRHRIVVS